jgi:HEPN domain-containing protein
MDDAKRDLIRAWLIKSRNDLDTARQISLLPEGHLDTAIYHCQQAAEKAIKAFLAFHDHELERTHDLKRLLQIAATEPDRAEFDEALQLAMDFVTFVLARLPAEVTPKGSESSPRLNDPDKSIEL